MLQLLFRKINIVKRLPSAVSLLSLLLAKTHAIIMLMFIIEKKTFYFRHQVSLEVYMYSIQYIEISLTGLLV